MPEPCIYRFECREAKGAENVETDIFYSALDYCYLRFELSDRSDSSGYLEPQSYAGSFNLYLRYDDISDEGRYINIFQNLPDISCLDFLKALGHITGTYPIMKDGAVKYRRYSEIEDNISISCILFALRKIIDSICTNKSKTKMIGMGQKKL